MKLIEVAGITGDCRDLNSVCENCLEPDYLRAEGNNKILHCTFKRNDEIEDE